jgi:HEAT repeat protein
MSTAYTALAGLRCSLAFDSLVFDLAAGNPRMRAAAANALGEIDDRRVDGPLLAARRDSNDLVRKAVYSSLAKLHSKPVTDSLVRDLSSDNPQTRTLAVTTLGGIGDRRVFSHVVRLLADSSWRVRGAVVQTLPALDGKRSVRPLIRFLADTTNWNDDRKANVIVMAVEQVGKLRARRAVPYLARLIYNPRSNVREAAAAALCQIGGKQAGEACAKYVVSAPKNGIAVNRWWPLLLTLDDPRVEGIRRHYYYVYGFLDKELDLSHSRSRCIRELGAYPYWLIKTLDLDQQAVDRAATPDLI